MGFNNNNGVSMVSATILFTSHLVLVLVGLQGSTAVRIEIEPSTNVDTSTATVRISCTPDVNSTHDISLIQLTRDGQSMALLRRDSSISYDHDYSADGILHMQAKGHIFEKDPAQSYFNVSIHYPVKRDGGEYTCGLYYMVGSTLELEQASQNLTWGKANVSTLGEVVRDLLGKVSSLQKRMDNKVGNKDDDLSMRVAILETKAKNRTEQIEEITQKDQQAQTWLNDLEKNAMELIKDPVKAMTEAHQDMAMKFNDGMRRGLHGYRLLQNNFPGQIGALETNLTRAQANVAFSATSNYVVIIGLGKPIILPEVTLNKGQGYNHTTGVFTAPQAGLYNFDVLIRTFLPNHFLGCDLTANDKVIAKLYVGDKDTTSQSNVNALVDLKAGDTVKVITTHFTGGNIIHGGLFFNQFSGYLVRRSS